MRKKTMGIITVFLFSTGYLHGDFHVPLWVVLAAQVAMGLGTLMGGWRIMKTILHLFRIERPVLFYGSFSLFLAALAIVLAIPLVITYLQTGLVPRFPTAVLSTGLMILAALSFMCGLILDTVVRGRREVRRLHYLSLPAPGAASSR